MDAKTYSEISRHLSEIETILTRSSNRNEKMYPNEYKPVRLRLSEINSKINSISEF